MRLSTTILVALLTGCGQWPPYDDELIENFEENRSAFEMLDAKIADTDYALVYLFGVPRSDGTYDVFGEYRDERDFDGQELTSIEDRSEWERLFRQGNIFSAEKYDSGVAMGTTTLPARDRTIFARYVHSSAWHEGIRACMLEHEDLACGYCGVDLAEDWYIEYRWWPSRIAPSSSEALAEGRIGYEEYQAEFYEALETCRRDGYSEIGYELLQPE